MTLDIPVSRLAVIPGDILGTEKRVVEPGTYQLRVGDLTKTFSPSRNNVSGGSCWGCAARCLFAETRRGGTPLFYIPVSWTEFTRCGIHGRPIRRRVPAINRG